MSIYTSKFCVYLTVYTGSKLPMFYIGSTSVYKINNGYLGSVASKKYKSIFNHELKHNKHLFKTHIVSLHDNRKDATIKENKLQTLLRVVKSTMYFNMSTAKPNGYCGMDTSGKNNPNYKRQHTQETKDFLRQLKLGKHGHAPTPETRVKLSIAKTGNKNPNHGKPLTTATEAAKIANTGKTRHPDIVEKSASKRRGKPQKRASCPYCNISGNMGNLKRWHFDNCKLKSSSHILESV